MRKILLYIFSIISAAIIPVLIALSIMITLFLSPDFHVRVIKNLDLVKTFIEAKNLEVESDIKREIEKKTGITAFKSEYDSVKKDYDEKLLAFNKINKTEDFKNLEKQIDEVDDLEWEKSSDSFKTEDEFKSFKKHKMKELKAALEEIENYRDKNEDAIDKSEDEMKKAEEIFEDADDEMKDKEKDAREIIEDRQGEFVNEMYHDISKIEPVLTEKLNTLFLEKEIKNIITTYLDFLTSYPEQKNAGNVYQSRLNVESGLIDTSTNVKIPPLSMSFIVKVNDNGIEKEKNLLSEVFAETVKSTPGLKSPWVMSKLFTMSDSWIAEKAGRSVLKGTGISYSGGVIKSGPITLTGEKGDIAERVMIGMTAGKYLPYAAGAISLILLILIFILSSGKKNGIKNAGYILKYPSMIIAIAGIALILISLVPGLLLPEIISDPLKYAFLDRAASTAVIYMLIPVTALFFILSLVGSFMVKMGKR
jgi:hypothetical protein